MFTRLNRMGWGNFVSVTFLLIVLAAFQTAAQTLPITNNAPPLELSFVEKSDDVLLNVSRSAMTTDILYDRILPLADLDVLNGQPGAETSHSEHFFQANYELYSASYYKTGLLSNDDLINRVTASCGANTYPIGVLYYNYNKLIPTAIQDNLLRYDNGKLYDVAGRPRPPFMNSKAVVATPLLHPNAPFYKPGWLTFKLDQAFFLTNTTANLAYCQIDFGDGNGFRRVNPNNSVAVYYGSPGKRNIQIQLFTTDGQQSFANASVTVANATAGDRPYADWNDNEVCNATPVQFSVTGDAFSDQQYEPNQITNYGAEGTVTIYFAKGNCQNKVLRKPVIFLDGFDPTNARDYKTIYKDYINDEDVLNYGSNLKLADKSRNDGYDIIVIDYKDSGDYIERNGLMVQKAIQELWARYSATIEQNFVVIGPSMGALVAQYALADAERRNIDHHTRLYISFDGPHRGANIPIGLQQMIGYGLSSKVVQPKPQTSCRPPTAGVVEDDFPLNIRSAKQMLLHHYLTRSESPAPHIYRYTFLQNMAAVGYPHRCRKIAVINGSRSATKQRAGSSAQTLNREMIPSEDILRVELRSKAANFFLSSDKTILGWGATATPANGLQNTFHAFTASLLTGILGVNRFHDDYASPYPFANGHSLDILPGGAANTMEQIVNVVNAQDEVSFYAVDQCIALGYLDTPVGFLDLNFPLKLLKVTLKSGQNYSVYSNTPVHSFVPTVSSVDFNDSNVLSYNFDGQDLSCSGKTPFDRVYAPAENQLHVAITPENATWFENEIKLQNIPANCGAGCDFRSFTNPIEANCGQQIQLTTTCSGADCNSQLNYTWVGDGISQNGQNGQTITINAPSVNRNYIYSVSVTKPGCSGQSTFLSVNVTGCNNPTPPAGNPTCYEAENAARSSTVSVQAGGNASGGQYVGGFDGASGYVDFAVSAATAGTYPLTLYTASGEANGYLLYSVNGAGAAQLNLTATGGWNQFQANSPVNVALNAGNNTIRVQGGVRFTLDKICVGGTGGTTPPPPPPSGSLAFTTPAFDCNSGLLTLNTTGGDGSTVEFSAPGLQGWSTNNVLTIPSYQRNGITFTLNARQSGNQISTTYTTACGGGGARFSISEPTANELVAWPNPTDDVLTVQLARPLPANPTFTLTDVSGRAHPVGSHLSVPDGQRVRLTVRHLAAGQYVLRIGGDETRPQIVRFVKQ